jgi:regulator of protease activity HflC (stomatin/prohibitin superfamily)
MVAGAVLLALGFSKQRDLWFATGAWILFSATCLAMGFIFPPFSWLRFVITLALIEAVLLVGGLVSKMRMFYVIGALWAWFWFAAIRGYTRGGWIGVLLIAVPACVVPTIVLSFVSRYLLPLRDPGQRAQAFKSLLTFVLGTNFPYYVVKSNEWGLDKIEHQTRIGGSAFGALLAGPGVALSSCDHAPIVSDGVTFKGVKTPGVSFIGFADSVPQAVDLRTQLRAFFVEARTKDGIGVKVLAFAPFHIDCGIDIPRLGQPFPFRAQAAFKALHKAQLIEHTDKGQVPERMEAHLWDDLPRVIGTRVLRDIIAKYRFDDLCAPYKLADDPRDEIVKEFKNQLGNELQSCGIKLVGGGISNLLPAEKSRRQIFEQRIRSWQVHWVRHAMQLQAQGQRSRLRQIEKARAQAQVEVVQTLSDRLIRLQETETIISSEEIVKMFIDMINQVALRPLVRRLLPDGLTDSVQQMGQRVEGYNHESGTGR